MAQFAYLREDRLVAASPSTPAPEYRIEAVLRREFDPDSPALRLMILGPNGARMEYWDSRQLALAISVLERALPALREAEERVELEWQVWRESSELADTAEGDG